MKVFYRPEKVARTTSYSPLEHSPVYVRGVFAGEVEGGFDNSDRAVTASLPFTSGSLVAAAEFAVRHQDAACSPTSAFHHAGYDQAEGYCTFNGLMVNGHALEIARSSSPDVR